MLSVDYILDGLEAELELERELGVRTVEIDRSLLQDESKAPSGIAKPDSVVKRSAVPKERASPAPAVNANPSAYDFVFIHDGPLSSGGAAIMEKIVAAMGKTAASAPIVYAQPFPKAKLYVMLGSKALQKFLPGKSGEPGQWIKGNRGQDVLITYSPEYFLRFPTVTVAVDRKKREMWQSLKSVMQRVRAIAQ